ncbi:HIT family protein [Platysternon megacephalum]|uniref:HIT family protein n=1 Tax=Platysternon megacephalum TaxID=55544 RepID=A0A4D9DJE2_9SAUR|nr:HIT family protein [Platysternon megacephalum]
MMVAYVAGQEGVYSLSLSLLPAGRCLKRIGEFSVLQQPPRAVKEAGDSVEMTCTLALPPGHPRPSSVLVTWHRGHRGDGLTGTGKLSEVEELRGRVDTAWLENVSASTLHIHTLQHNDSALYLCLFVVFPSAQPCVLEGNGTRLTVTGFSARGNRTQISSEHRELPEHHWTIRLLALGVGIVLTAAVVLCLHRTRAGCGQRSRRPQQEAVSAALWKQALFVDKQKVTLGDEERSSKARRLCQAKHRHSRKAPARIPRAPRPRERTCQLASVLRCGPGRVVFPGVEKPERETGSAHSVLTSRKRNE